MRFFSISVIYFRNSQVNVDLLISFRPPRNKQNLVLEEIKFFDKKQDLLNYIKSNNLEIIDTVSDVVLQGIKKIIEDYLSGKKVNIFDGILELNVDLQLDEKFKSEFSHDVVECLTQLKYGEVVTYSEIGKRIGSRAYRAIGNILKKNPLPLIVPCHRVIKKNGIIGGFMGDTKGNWQQALKRKLLQIENITLK